jgi:hypothetical protein
MRRERVAKQVRVDAAGLEAGALGQLAEDEKGARAGQSAAARVQEQLRPVAPVEVRPPEREVAAHRLGRRTPERHEPLLAALPQHAYDPVLERDAVLLQARGLGDAQAGSVEELDESSVAQRARRRPDGGVDEALGLRRRERAR